MTDYDVKNAFFSYVGLDNLQEHRYAVLKLYKVNLRFGALG